MKAKESGAAGFLLLLGVVAATEAHKLALGRPGNPGPGLFPFSLALALIATALLLLVGSLRPLREGRTRGRESVGQPEEQSSDGRFSEEQSRPGKAAGTLLLLAGYAAALEPLGFLISTFLLLLLLYGVIEPRKWPVAIGGSLAATVLTYLLFHLLQVRLPAGWWAP